MEEKGLFEYWKECYTLKYVDFNGRARCLEYWGGLVLFNAILRCLLYIVFLTFGIFASALHTPSIILIGIVITGAINLFTLMPSLAGAVRRLHDTGREWYFILLGLVPIANLVLIYFLTQDSQPEENKFGPNPKGL